MTNSEVLTFPKVRVSESGIKKTPSLFAGLISSFLVPGKDRRPGRPSGHDERYKKPDYYDWIT